MFYKIRKKFKNKRGGRDVREAHGDAVEIGFKNACEQYRL